MAGPAGQRSPHGPGLIVVGGLVLKEEVEGTEVQVELGISKERRKVPEPVLQPS
jgi:hypothetical protein